MDCRNIQRVIYKFIYQESDERELRAIKTHLDKCQSCRAEAEVIEGILKGLKRDAVPETPPEGMKERMLKEIHRRADKPAAV